MIGNQLSYNRNDRMRDIINDNSILLTVINRFSISLGFGDKTVAAVCEENDVDVDTFLAVVNLISGKDWSGFRISLPSLIRYLRKSHRYILNYALPNIKKTLIEGIQQTNTSELAIFILKFYDSYVKEVRKHTEYEDNVVFSYVENLIAGDVKDRFQIADFSSSHEHIAGTLDELKEIFIYQYNQKENDLISIALFNIIVCGNDLMSHCEIENKLLFPAVLRLEQSLKSQTAVKSLKEDSKNPAAITEILTDREKEVITEVAQGLSNKEIAEKLNLSFHTITTYRKNISSKLNIHSTAGLVIFAILHHLIEIDEARLPELPSA